VLHFLWEAIIGLVVGALAKLVMPGPDGGGILVTMILGMAGSVIASFILRAVGWYQEGQTAGFIASFAGAVLILWIYRLIKSKSAA
jgi:uncharacterized membrane protein YeaQ/YmgE (transglycosylase-associated protein family)